MPEPGFVQHVRRIATGEPMFVDVVSVQLFVEDRDALQARVTELEESLKDAEMQAGYYQAGMESWHSREMDVIAERDARVEVLTAALRPFVESRIPSSDPDAWFAMFRNARAALAAGETESEAP